MRMPLLLLLLLPFPLHAGPELDALRTVAVQDDGRVKPLDTFAREAARRVTGARAFGGETVAGVDPVRWVVSLSAEPDRWKQERIVRVPHAALRRALGLSPERDRFSFLEIVELPAFGAAVERIQGRLAMDSNAALDPVDRETLDLYDALGLMAGIISGEAVKVVPAPGNAPWASLAETGDARVQSLWGAVAAAAVKDDPAALAAAARPLAEELRARPGAASVAAMTREVHYNRFKPFRWAWLSFGAAFLVLLAAIWAASPWPGRAGILLLAAGVALTTYGFALRVLISGRAPVSNMYESVLFCAWGTALLALIFDVRNRNRVLGASAAALSTVGLLLAEAVPIFDSAIAPLVPVLRDNFWLTTHVLTITLGYAAFFLAMGLGHVSLGLVFFGREAGPTSRGLATMTYRALQVGTLFLALGTLLGGVWASYSWGRFWGWDPKETWALIALLAYLVLLHARTLGAVRDLGLAVGSVLGFLGVVMAWYGVNYILGTGLHSYGFGAGGVGYVAAYAGFEAAYCVAALLVRANRAAAAALATRTPVVGGEALPQAR